MNFEVDQIKQKLAESKAKISELDILISRLSSNHELQEIEDDHPPVDGQPFIYQFFGNNKALTGFSPINNGDQGEIGIPIDRISAASPFASVGLFSGKCQIDSDSSFICTDIQAVVQQTIIANPGLLQTGTDGWYPLTKSDYGPEYFNNSPANIGLDFGFRFIDEGTGRKLFQAEDQTGTEQYIPSRFLGNGLPQDVLGANYTDPLTFRHIFAKNTAIRLDLRVYNRSFSTPTDIAYRIHVGLIGYKVFGD